MTDILAARVFELTPLTWAADGDDLRDIESDERKKYVATIKAADKGEFVPLMEYLKDLNPELA
jgi:hypothetical protein